MSSILFDSYYFFTFRLGICGQVLAAQNQLTQLPGRRAPGNVRAFSRFSQPKTGKIFSRNRKWSLFIIGKFLQRALAGKSASGPHPDSSYEDLEGPRGIWRSGPDHGHPFDPPRPALLGLGEKDQPGSLFYWSK